MFFDFEPPVEIEKDAFLDREVMWRASLAKRMVGLSL
jgi:hypothetical protein